MGHGAMEFEFAAVDVNGFLSVYVIFVGATTKSADIRSAGIVCCPERDCNVVLYHLG